MPWAKTNVDGRDTYESVEGERHKDPDNDNESLHGYHTVIIDGTVMYESPDGTERVKQLND